MLAAVPLDHGFGPQAELAKMLQIVSQLMVQVVGTVQPQAAVAALVI